MSTPANRKRIIDRLTVSYMSGTTCYEPAAYREWLARLSNEEASVWCDWMYSVACDGFLDMVEASQSPARIWQAQQVELKKALIEHEDLVRRGL